MVRVKEEEIIKEVKTMFKDSDSKYWIGENGVKALQGLLDLYNKEKQKNKELLEERKSYAEEYIHNNPWLYKQLNELYVFKTTVKEKIDGKFREAKGLYERGVQPQAQYTMKLLRDLEEQLLNKEE